MRLVTTLADSILCMALGRLFPADLALSFIEAGTPCAL